ncbi:Lrp/AsnC family transcriptional regulator [bacterium]|nr:Lrp/AsnC family transcriptional regulator [bacterium]
MSKIDSKDISIINLLVEDGRMSCSQIAKKMGNITERAVRYRIDRLLADETIKISAIASPEKTGYPVTADVFVEVESASIEKVAKELAEYECVSYVACSIGNLDISIQIFAKDNSAVYQFMTEVVGKMPGVIKTKTSIFPFQLKAAHDWRIPTSSNNGFNKIKYKK